MLFTEGQVGLVTPLAGGNVRMRYAEVADMAMAFIVQTLHQGNNRPLIVVTDGGKTVGIARQHHHRRLPGLQHLLFDAGKTEQHHAVNVAPLEHTQMLFNQLRGELALHHDWVVALLIKGGQHGLNGEVLGQGIQTRDDNGNHFVTLPAHGARRAGRGKTVLIHYRLDALAGAFADTALIVEHTRYGGFPHAA